MIEGMTVKPYQVIPWHEYISYSAWAEFCCFAVGDQDIREQFKKETGNNLSNLIDRNAIEEMVDKQTGFEKETVLAFLDWVTINHWGVDE